MGFYNGETTINEIIAIIIHFISILSLILVIYLTYQRNNLVTYFSIANIGQHLSKLFRLVIFGFTMEHSPLWSCYVHAFTNFLTVGMESYISMLFAMRLWLMITRKNEFKMWILENTKHLTYICGFGIPIFLSFFSVLPQIFKGSSFKIPSEAENCITGYRQNYWQILLSGPGTTLPPFLLSSVFAANIVFVICTVSTNNIMKDVKKFSTISYSSWIRMLWFGVFFGFVVVINVLGDFKNASALKNKGIPEPGIKNIPITYYVTAAVGFGVLLIFGTTPEAKKKISSLVKNSFSGISSSMVSSSKRSQNKSQTYNISTQDLSSQKGSNFSMSNNTSTYTLKEMSATSLASSRSESNLNIPLFKNSVKPKKPVGELEASLEFNKFMKSVNDIMKDEDDDDFVIDVNNLKGYNAYGTDSNIIKFGSDSDLKNYQPPPNYRMLNNNITPRMMVPIQKISSERLHQQQMHNASFSSSSGVNDYNSNNSSNNSNSRDDKALLNKKPKKQSSGDSSTYYQSSSNPAGYNMIEEEIENEGRFSIRDGIYTEEILFPAKVSTSKIVKKNQYKN